MKLTNKYRLPAPLVLAVKHFESEYKAGALPDSISTTTLIRPVQQVELRRRHEDALTEDVSDRIWALRGQIEHGILEAAGKELTKSLGHDPVGASVFIEKRFSVEVLRWTVSGRIDYFEDGILTDYKDTSVWNYVYGKPEWELQGNVNRYLMEMNGITVKGLRNTLVFRDFQESKAGLGRYPERGVLEVVLPMWTLEKARQYIEGRVQLFQENREREDGALTECTDEDRKWNARQKVYVMCERYCPVRDFCKQRKKEG